MGKELWRQERAELQAVLDDLKSGNIKLQNGADDYIASVRRRIDALDALLLKSG